eukprot:12283426-Alexandrium_andersonii.AAC.1
MQTATRHLSCVRKRDVQYRARVMQNSSAVEDKTKQWLTMGVGWSLEQLAGRTKPIPELRS